MPRFSQKAKERMTSGAAMMPMTAAALVAAVRRELSARKAVVSLPGGDLTIEWRQSDGHVLMTGPVEFEWEGTLAPELFEAAA